MADNKSNNSGTESTEERECHHSPAEKRKSTGEEDGPPNKKITMSIKSWNQDSTPKPTLGFGIKKPASGIKMSLNSQKPKETPVNTTVIKKSTTVAQAFNSDSEDDEEEMPPEAKMRMKNVGRETPTAAGPNSFGKGKLGFTNHHRILEKEIEKQIKESGD